MQSSATLRAARDGYKFNYPRTFTGVNSAFTNLPQTEVEVDKNHKEGDLANYAHQNIRKFPEWYKPYGFNYDGQGWLVFLLGALCVGGYSYLNDVAMYKGRKARKAYPLHAEGVMSYQESENFNFYKRRVEAGDPEYTKFLEKKPRASA
eukprot:CAMPEP_0170494630 /NCGR_PEP_ID=MMETSP0208-20121228/14753_1 /TAXON_ID=197538 /ORGANISM="Strombidium inclinatum, Strain S3" /LENGTH=148 /DNA_ID=CAMNT_0010770713 /DNA_START=21 /DNA_END=464 /DNA_ORIENTATION=-